MNRECSTIPEWITPLLRVLEAIPSFGTPRAKTHRSSAPKRRAGYCATDNPPTYDDNVRLIHIVCDKSLNPIALARNLMLFFARNSCP